MPRENREIWKKRLERWAGSGLTTREFAAEIGVNANTLANWRWRFSAEARQKAGTSAQPSFVEVVGPLVTGASRAATWPAAVPPTPEPIELVLSSGIRVRVPPRFDAAALLRVVDVLGGR
jgi:transposase-like protein